jgi:hypothetical protein
MAPFEEVALGAKSELHALDDLSDVEGWCYLA